MQKMVNGVAVDCSAQEEAAITAEWAAADAAQPARLAEVQRKADVEAAIAADATIQALKVMTNTQYDAWWTANVTNLAQANNVLKRLTRVVIRRLL